MNWKLVFQLSLFGLAMAIATVFWIPSGIEALFWLVIFFPCAYLIAKKCSRMYFLNGFMVSMVNSVWITAAHVVFFEAYMAHHPEMAQMSASIPMADSPRLMMIIMGPFFGASFGLILGLFAFVASKVMKRSATAA